MKGTEVLFQWMCFPAAMRVRTKDIAEIAACIMHAQDVR